MISPEAIEVFDIFKQINNIPRPSWHEEKIADFLCDFAKGLALDFERDNNNCVVIRKPATKGYENVSPVALLNHADMVCVADARTEYDPLTSPIRTYMQDGWIRAHGTSLGADNGIGLAMALAVLKAKDIPHPTLEVITTTNEEDGMTGAANLSKDFIKAKKIINLDSEGYDTITVGSAGALLQFSNVPFTYVSIPKEHNLWNIRISGGLGGHSGVDIDKHRTNANKLMINFLLHLNKAIHFILVDINGGEASNAIAAKCKATIAVPQKGTSILLAAIAYFQTSMTKKYGIYENNLHIEYKEQYATTIKDEFPKAIAHEVTIGFLLALQNIPSGTIVMSNKFAGTVETSNNIGCIRSEKGYFFASNYSRSFCDTTLQALGQKIRNSFSDINGISNIIMEAPAWQSNLQSPFVTLVENTFYKVLGFNPRKVIMHFALESGYFVKKYPGIEIVSIGPKIISPHSITERVSIKSVNDIWEIVKKLLADMKQFQF